MAAGWSRVTLKAVLFVVLGTGWSWGTPRSPGLPTIAANDMRTPAGQESNDTLRIRLEVRMGVWRPEADSGTGAARHQTECQCPRPVHHGGIAGSDGSA